MSRFQENSTDFAADCRHHEGRCPVLRENVLFLDSADEGDAVGQLQWRCGYVVVIPGADGPGASFLYHTSCQRMSDVVERIFRDCLEGPVRVAQRPSEMSLGELHRRRVALSWADCQARVESFAFEGH